MIDKLIYRVVPAVLFVLIILAILPQTSGTMLELVALVFLRR